MAVQFIQDQADRMVCTARQGMRSDVAGRGGRRFSCFMVSVNLRDARALKVVLIQALKALFHPADSTYYTGLLEDNTYRVPSQTVLSHARLVIDVAFMKIIASRRLAQLDEVGPSMVIFMWSDSSPQFGVNWQNSSYDFIQGPDVSFVADKLRE
jgi:hypothetical protein